MPVALEDLDMILHRWASARMTAEVVVVAGKDPTYDDFMELYRAVEAVPALVARVRKYEPLA